MEYKLCSCKNHQGERSLPITLFYKNKSQLDGLSVTCKICTRAAQQQGRTANIELRRMQDRERYHDKKDRILEQQKIAYDSKKSTVECVMYQMLHNAKSRAKAKGLEFSLTIEDIKIPDACPVLGIPLQRGIGQSSDNSPTLDRIDSSQGYTKDNVIVISKRANTIKNSGTPQEHKQIYEFFSSYNIYGK